MVPTQSIPPWRPTEKAALGANRSRRLWSTRAHGERGDVAESVIVFPVFFLFILLSIQIAMWAHGLQVVQNAAASGDQAARAFGGSAVGATVQAERFVDATNGTSALTDVHVSVTFLPGGMSRVEVVGEARSILPWFHVRVSAVRIGPVQRFRSSG